jgi:hypothetical protein
LGSVTGAGERGYVALFSVGADQQSPPARVQAGRYMSLDRPEMLVIGGAIILIGFVLWYFFGSRR